LFWSEQSKLIKKATTRYSPRRYLALLYARRRYRAVRIAARRCFNYVTKELK